MGQINPTTKKIILQQAMVIFFLYIEILLYYIFFIVCQCEFQSDSEYSCNEKTATLITQQKLDFMVRNLKLPNNLLHPDTTFSWYRSRESSYVDFYKTQDQICFCVDTKGLLLNLSYSDDPNNWYLFIDSSQRSFKAMLLKRTL